VYISDEYEFDAAVLVLDRTHESGACKDGVTIIVLEGSGVFDIEALVGEQAIAGDAGHTLIIPVAVDGSLSNVSAFSHSPQGSAYCLTGPPPSAGFLQQVGRRL
jgi:hypothetical protein